MASQVSVVARSHRRTTARRWLRGLPALHELDLAFAGCLLLTAVLLAGILVWNELFPPVLFVVPVVLAGVFLTPRRMFVSYAVVALSVIAGVVRTQLPVVRGVAVMMALVSVMVVMTLAARSRSRLGLTGFRTDTMLVDLRDRVMGSASVPPLPDMWVADSAIHSAFGDGFSGDFMVSALSRDGRQLEVALVDVSGKGTEAGSRSLLLSGAFGGIAGSVACDDFLARCNSYLIRQQWEEGFATGVHACVDLATGDFSVSSAGHPPAAQFHRGTGTWRIIDDGRGALLGVMDGLTFPRSAGRLDPGDALLLYTDGVIEARGRELVDGLDRMLGVASKAMVAGGEDVADQVCAAARSGRTDDRAAFVIRRR